MSALPPKADIDWRWLDVRFVPKADITSIKQKDRLAAVFSKSDLGVLLRRQKPPPPRQDGDHNDYPDCDP